MLYGLFFLTCLVDNPAHCVTRVHSFSEEVSTPQHCLTVAQAQMAQWGQSHPRWQVTRFRCGKPPRDLGTRV